MVIKRISPMSCAKVSGLLYALMGFIVGACVSLFAMVLGGTLASQSAEMGETGGQLFGALFGIGAIVLLPLFYGVMGFVVGAVTSVIYNFVAGVTGGLEIEVQ
jgi:hypothetical protein